MEKRQIGREEKVSFLKMKEGEKEQNEEEKTPLPQTSEEKRNNDQGKTARNN
jgi:hypothetical protein